MKEHIHLCLFRRLKWSCKSCRLWIISSSSIFRLKWIKTKTYMYQILYKSCSIKQIGCVFVEYDLIYIRFGIILTQFYINFSRQEHPIDVLCILLNAWDSQVSSYTPFHFSFTVPLRRPPMFWISKMTPDKFSFLMLYLKS